MKKRLNIKIEEVKIDQEFQVIGMFGGPCGGGGNDGNHGRTSASNDRSNNNSYGANGLDRSVACGGCHGVTSDYGRDVNKAIGTTARDTVVGGWFGGILGGIEAGITSTVISAENISNTSYSGNAPWGGSKGKSGYTRSDGLH